MKCKHQGNNYQIVKLVNNLELQIALVESPRLIKLACCQSCHSQGFARGFVILSHLHWFHISNIARFNFVGQSLKLSTYRKRLAFEIKICNMEYVIFIFYSIYTLDLKRDKAFLCCGQSSLTLIVSTVS